MGKTIVSHSSEFLAFSTSVGPHPGAASSLGTLKKDRGTIVQECFLKINCIRI